MPCRKVKYFRKLFQVRRTQLLPYCRKCKGYKILCKLESCPMAGSFGNPGGEIRIGTGDISSLTPPGVFIGTYDYPNVYAGPLAVADPNMEYPSGKLYGRSIEDIIALNRNVYRASQKTKVDDVGSKFSISVQESSMSVNYVDMELNVVRRLDSTRDNDRSNESPMRSMVELGSIRITSNPKIPGKVDYFHGDTGLKAEEAVWTLYQRGFEVNYLEGVLSSGALGLEKRRRLVPTRWAITAVDDIIYRNMKRELADYPPVSNISVFRNSYLGNNFTVILLPYSLSFEMQEMWGSGGNMPSPPSVSLDYELTDGRKKYASNVGGAYYAARLAVLEHLSRIRKQATAIVLRTIGKEYYAPLGVWLIREAVRDSFNKGATNYATVEELVREEKTGIQKWASISKVLKGAYVQKSIFEYV